MLWDFLGWSTDTVSMYNREVNERVLRDYLFKKAQWNQVYDVVEKAVELTFWPIDSDDLLRAFNGVLEAEVSGYRFIGNKMAPISSEEEVSTIEEALDRASPIKPVMHILRALFKCWRIVIILTTETQSSNRYLRSNPCAH